MKAFVTLKFNNIGQELIHQFPVDKDSDITLLLNGRETFQLQIMLLKCRSKYFETQLQQTDSKFKVIPNMHDTTVFQKILHCFYGYQYHIYKDGELYSAYLISHFLQIHQFIDELQEAIQENIDRINFLYIYTIAEMMEVEFIKEKYMEYLDENPQLWKSLLPISKLENFRLNFSQSMETKANSHIPENIFLLEENIFKKLILLHNEQKVKKSIPEHYLPADDIFKIIQYYVKTRYLNQEERKVNTMRLIKDIFKWEEIVSDVDARKLYNFMTKSQQSESGSNKNHLYQAQIHKLYNQQRRKKRSRNKNKDCRQLKSTQYKLMTKENDELKLENKLLQDRVKILLQLIEKQKNQTQSNNNEFETSQFVNQQTVSIPCNSMYESKDNSFFRNTLHFNSTPQTVFSTSELTYLWDILNVKIYQQIKFKLLYRGQRFIIFSTENNFYLTSEEQLDQIKKANSILILIRSVENNSVFGIFNEYNKIQVINFQTKRRIEYKKELKLAINQNYLLKLGTDIEILVDCCNRNDNTCNSIPGLGCLAGKSTFQVDELEIYQCSIHNEIV